MSSIRRIVPPLLMLPLLASLDPAGAELRGQGDIEDPRDGQSYPTIKVAEMTWFARNLNFETPHSFCYGGDEANCARYGRLYRWEAALSACPTGWHLSTELEWQALELALGLPDKDLEKEGNRGSQEGGRLKAGGDSGFDAQLGGWRKSEDGKYEALDRAAALWTASESSPQRAWHRDVDVGDNQIWRSPVIKPYALSVRCVKNRFEADEAADHSRP